MIMGKSDRVRESKPEPPKSQTATLTDRIASTTSDQTQLFFIARGHGLNPDKLDQRQATRSPVRATLRYPV